MKKTFFFLSIVSILILTSCTPQNKPEPDIQDISWKFIKSQNSITKETKEFPDSLGDYLMYLHDNGKVVFNNYCNIGSMKYVSDSYSSISFQQTGPYTHLYCIDLYDWEMFIINNLENATSYEISGNELRIKCNNEELYFLSSNTLITNKLENTSWIFAPLRNAMDIAPSDIYKIHFKEKGVIEFPYHCNYSYGQYTTGNNSSIRIENLGPATELYCSPGLSEVENYVINNLNNAYRYKINSNELLIYCSGDHVLQLIRDDDENYKTVQIKN